MPDMTSLNQEHFVVLLNIKTKLFISRRFYWQFKRLHRSSKGNLSRSCQRSAASIICAHNHPSGVPTPSTEDIEVTKRIVEAGYIIGIELIDHVIIGDHQYISLKEKDIFNSAYNMQSFYDEFILLY